MMYEREAFPPTPSQRLVIATDFPIVFADVLESVLVFGYLVSDARYLCYAAPYLFDPPLIFAVPTV